MNPNNLTIHNTLDHSEVPFELLELADPSRVSIAKYLSIENCYIAKKNDQIIGVILLKEVTRVLMEVKNIAVDPFFQGKGFGRHLLRHASEISKKSGYKNLMIKTRNSSILQLALYQKEGFEMRDIRRNFYTHMYQTPIFENGIQCKHMIVLIKNLA